jgi:hypothetical protein
MVAARFGNKVSIAAAAMTEVEVSPERGSLALAEEAFSAVPEKSGTDRSEIDGFVWNLGTSAGENYDVITANSFRAHPTACTPYSIGAWQHLVIR